MLFSMGIRLGTSFARFPLMSLAPSIYCYESQKPKFRGEVDCLACLAVDEVGRGTAVVGVEVDPVGRRWVVGGAVRRLRFRRLFS